MSASIDDQLRREVGYLGTVLGETIRRIGGEQALTLVEAIRHQSRGRRTGSQQADQRIKQLIADMDDSELRTAIRAFTVFLDLLNMAEDRQRVRVLRQRADDAYPVPRRESIRAAIAEFKEAGLSAAEVQKIVDRLHVELVFTAHPTEAKRRSVRNKLRVIRQLLQQRDSDLGREAGEVLARRIGGEVAKLWQTDFIRPWRPSVMQEVGRGLSIKPVLWATIPRIASDLATALHENFGDQVRVSKPCITFGSWMGGDRDGHPGVTAEVTAETFEWLRREALEFHLQTCDTLLDSLSHSRRQVEIDAELPARIEAARQSWPTLVERLAPIPPDELFRQWLQVIRWRLEQTACQPRNHAGAEGGAPAYRSACELAGEVRVLSEAIANIDGTDETLGELASWQAQINTFGLHLAKLDVRQNAKVYRQVLDELFRDSGLCDHYAALDEAGKCKLLQESLEQPLSTDVAAGSAIAQETMRLFQTLHRVGEIDSPSAIGAHVISMTAQPSDVLAVLWFWYHTDPNSSAQQRSTCIPIVPLLETIDDLHHGPEILAGLLAIPAYRDHLRRHDDRQLVMLGYSDSTKDGGYLSACWSLHQAQRELVSVARRHDLELVFFHGRGGSLGRGGGPAARSILSLPEGTFHGQLRLTEQGEVLADRYDDPRIAYRHLEQVVWSSLLATQHTTNTDSRRWYESMDDLAERSLSAYRQLLEQPDFVEYFRRATPIAEIEQLPIGSRPSRRNSDGGLEDLRAIPWVFSWTQSRCLLPAWYGIGAAMQPGLDQPETLQQWRHMYQHWPFFRAMIDNAELALAKSDAEIASEYAGLAGDRESLRNIASLIQREFHSARRAVLALTEREELLDGIAWLKESIRLRNRYIDPLNLIQVELLRRSELPGASVDTEELRHLTRLTINGIAAGMRTSG